MPLDLQGVTTQNQKQGFYPLFILCFSNEIRFFPVFLRHCQDV